MSEIRVNTIKSEDGNSPVSFNKGINVSGVTTATSFSGALTGDATGLSGTPDITVRNVTGVGATFSGDLNVSGTLNYEDVANIDSTWYCHCKRFG